MTGVTVLLLLRMMVEGGRSHTTHDRGNCTAAVAARVPATAAAADTLAVREPLAAVVVTSGLRVGRDLTGTGARVLARVRGGVG